MKLRLDDAATRDGLRHHTSIRHRRDLGKVDAQRAGPGRGDAAGATLVAVDKLEAGHRSAGGGRHEHDKRVRPRVTPSYRCGMRSISISGGVAGSAAGAVVRGVVLERLHLVLELVDLLGHEIADRE